MGAGLRRILATPGREPSARPSVSARRQMRPIVEPDRTRAVVLLYHAFDRGSTPHSVSSTRFEEQLRWLFLHDIEIIRLSDLVEFLEGKRALPARVAVITIDDGLRSVYDKAFPILKRLGVPFTLGLPTHYIQHPMREPMLSWIQVREMLASGLCEVASHGHRRRALTVAPDEWAKEELELSRRLIIEQTGREPIAYFYPLGSVDQIAERRVLGAHYRAAFAATGAPIALGSSSLTRLPRTSILHDDHLSLLAWYSGPALTSDSDQPRAER